MTSAQRRTYLILDPYDAYAVELIRRAFLSFGLRPVCLYTDPAMRDYLGPLFPELKPELVEEDVACAKDELGLVAGRLARRYEVLGVLPYLEYHLEHTETLLRALHHTAWNEPRLVGRCRDKAALKRALLEGGVAVPEALPVRRAADLPREVRERWGRFVLKPNDGYSNRFVGFFDRATPDDVLERHLAQTGEAFVAEAYIEAEPADSDRPGACLEYSVNGQVDREGEAHVLAIFAVERVTANGREAVYRREWNIRHDDERFAELAAYAREVMKAIGMRSVPFHLEIRRTAEGPRLIDVGARLVGNGVATMVNRLHGGAVDVFDLALRGWLSLPERPITPDWERYDAMTFVRIYGIAEEDALVVTLEGASEVEAWPAFVEWVKKPRVGDRVVPTLDLDSFPWAVDLLVDGPLEEALALAGQVERQIRWNDGPSSWQEEAKSRARRLASRAGPRLRTLAGRAQGRLPPWMKL